MLFQIALFAAFSAFVVAERVAVQAGKSFCFFEDLKANTPWGIQFQSDEHEVRAIVSIWSGFSVRFVMSFLLFFLFSLCCPFSYAVRLKPFLMENQKCTVLTPSKLKWTVVTRFALRTLLQLFKRFPSTFWELIILLKHLVMLREEKIVLIFF